MVLHRAGVGEREVRLDTYRYPPLLMTTSTRDDRVHPYHARCFVKRLLEVQQEFTGLQPNHTAEMPAGKIPKV